MAMDRDWANLDAIALSLILDKLVERIDHVWFGAVCNNWCSVAKLNHQNQQQFKNNVLPMLMIPTESKSRTERSLYGIPSNRVYHFQLPVPYSGRCCGSSHGWLATVDRDYVITLLNPFKDVAPIHLPPININSRFSHKFSYEYNIHKVILSADPSLCPNDYVVVAIHARQNHLAFIRAGQKFWTYVHNYFCVTDITIYKGVVYAVSIWNDIVSFNLCYLKDQSGNKIIPKIVSRGRYVGEKYPERAYLVKSLEGDLWLVRRFISLYKYTNNRACNGYTRSFQVYKLELDAQDGTLLNKSRLESLGDNVLFLGDNESLSVSASYFSNCLQNDSIYFTDDCYDDLPISYPFGPFDNGIYNVKDGSLGKHYHYDPSFTRMPPPLWVLPSFKWD